jgi:small subunit ribosomal protein S16
MLAIRLQRTGRTGHAQYRVIVQDSHLSPKSGKVVAQLGSFDPHTKVTTLVKEKAQFYLDHGAQPSDRVIRILKSEGVKLPKWVEASPQKESKLKNPDKLRKNRPAEPETPKEEVVAEDAQVADTEAPVEAEVVETTEEPATEAPAEEAATEEVVVESEEKSADEPVAAVSEEETPTEEPVAEAEPEAESPEDKKA